MLTVYDEVNIQGGPKNGLFLRSDNFTMTNDKVYFIIMTVYSI